jgi:hypothetical protein
MFNDAYGKIVLEIFNASLIFMKTLKEKIVDIENIRTYVTNIKRYAVGTVDHECNNSPPINCYVTLLTQQNIRIKDGLTGVIKMLAKKENKKEDDEIFKLLTTLDDTLKTNMLEINALNGKIKDNDVEICVKMCVEEKSISYQQKSPKSPKLFRSEKKVT